MLIVEQGNENLNIENYTQFWAYLADVSLAVFEFVNWLTIFDGHACIKKK